MIILPLINTVFPSLNQIYLMLLVESKGGQGAVKSLQIFLLWETFDCLECLDIYWDGGLKLFPPFSGRFRSTGTTIIAADLFSAATNLRQAEQAVNLRLTRPPPVTFGRPDPVGASGLSGVDQSVSPTGRQDWDLVNAQCSSFRQPETVRVSRAGRLKASSDVRYFTTTRYYWCVDL
jgi:hypothetical protein